MIRNEYLYTLFLNLFKSGFMIANGSRNIMEYEIPFNRPCLSGNELKYIEAALRDFHISGDGVFSKRCSAYLEERIGVPKVLLTTSCTHALEMCALLLDIQPGDEVIVPSFAFVTTVNAFVLRGARPVFIDVRPDTLNLDETQLERLITARTKIIVALHYAGVGCEMDAIHAIAGQYKIAVVEDNAHGLFGRYKGRNLGTFGCLATLSFHETKNITCGEGGALLLNDEKYFERAEILREKGTNRSQFFRGEVDKYTWVDLGSSYLPSDILAAFLLAQLESSGAIQEQRKRIWQYYAEELAPWAEEKRVGLPWSPSYDEHPYHMFYMLCPSQERRSELIESLKSRGVLSVFHYLPLHLSPMGRKWGYQAGDCPVTEDISNRLVRLPFYSQLSPDDQKRVCDAIFQVSRRW
jgi:dTDP-4-amino-4,6-dideoxygalactose transaminase